MAQLAAAAAVVTAAVAAAAVGWCQGRSTSDRRCC